MGFVWRAPASPGGKLPAVMGSCPLLGGGLAEPLRTAGMTRGAPSTHSLLARFQRAYTRGWQASCRRTDAFD